jgi:hypothetical protein
MDTELELKQDASAPDRRPLYACSVSLCTSATVDDVSDLKRCERCDVRLCDSHAIERLTYVLCPADDRAEKVRLESLLPHLDKLIERLRNHSVGADEAEGILAALSLEASAIEGERR